MKFKKHIGLWWLLAICFLLFDLMLFISRFFADKPNEFGDSAGAVNGLFSAFAFAGVVYAIFLQKNELELQREELIQTREELKGQKHEFKQQNETLKRQRFENTFFNMLSLQQEIVKGLSYEYKKGNVATLINDREVFHFLYLKESLYVYIDSNAYLQASSLFDALKKDGNIYIHDKYAYSGQAIKFIDYPEKNIDEFKVYELSNFSSCLDHYFRHLYHIVKFVNDSPLLPVSYEDRYQYTCMIRAQLSKYELVWLFYNCLSKNGKDKFKPLIEKYALLKNIRFDLLAKPEHKALYNNSAYEKTPPEEN